MRRREFIDMILNGISDTFDIYHNYWFEGRKFVIYAYSYNKKDRFSTTDDAKLWDSKCYEHLFFINCDTLGMKELDDLYDFAVNKIEPHFVRGDGKLPAKNHMYTHISFIIITRNQVLPDVEKALKSKNYSKNYMFGARGFSKYNCLWDKMNTIHYLVISFIYNNMIARQSILKIVISVLFCIIKTVLI